MQKVIVNGANGYVASHFVNKMLKSGYKVVALVRNTPELTSEQRMKIALNEINAQPDFNNLQVHNYSLIQKDFSLNSKQLGDVFSGNVDFFHFAASLKFKSRDREEIFKINLEGVENSLKIFEDHASTAS